MFFIGTFKPVMYETRINILKLANLQRYYYSKVKVRVRTDLLLRK